MFIFSPTQNNFHQSQTGNVDSPNILGLTVIHATYVTADGEDKTEDWHKCIYQ